MGRKRILTIVCLLCLAAGIPVAAADGTDDSTKDEEGWFRLYLEAAYGNVALQPLDASIKTSTLDVSEGLFSIDQNAFGRAAIGWELKPASRGKFILKYEGYREDGYEYDAEGQQARAQGTSFLVSAPVTWWTVNAGPNGLHSVRTIPSWNSGLDANMNGVPDPGEIEYLEDPADRLTIDGTAPNDMQNRLQTIDAFYQRRFGGRNTRAVWTAGLRYYKYEGNISAGAWLNADFAGVGYTDGGTLRLLSFSQKASGAGPVASVELQQAFFRDRLQIYGNLHAAFVFATIETDSGRFYTLVRDGVFSPSPARLTHSTNKTTWQPGIEIGLRAMLVRGLHIYVSYLLNSYQDSMVTPTAIIIPESTGQAPQGVDGVYNTQDLEYDGGVLGLSFQW